VKHVVYTAAAAKDLRAYNNMAKRIMKAVREYADDGQAHANAVTQLVGSNAKRLRVGQFRVIFEENPETITVTKIGPRGNVYEGGD
jgi:mRNA interferase RelE/StbE